jgi:membrane-associated phospholipid phosphatase
VRAVLVLLCLVTGTAQAESWYRGKHGTNRVVHLSLTTIGFVVYPIAEPLEFGVECRWCGGPNALDRGVRNALVWSDDDRGRAAFMSDVTAYAATPTLTISLVLAGTIEDPSWAALIDDLVPVIETMVVTQWVTRALKIGVARTRPYAHFTGERDPDEDNLSFPSGHTSRAFALATSAGMLARARRYKSEPYIWATGLSLAAISGYLRIAADRHYFTDVIAGGSLGVAAGLTVPLLMKREIEVTPTGNGIAIAGTW